MTDKAIDNHSPRSTFIRGDAAVLITCILWGLGTVVMKNVIGDTPDKLDIFVYNGLRLPIGAAMFFAAEKMMGRRLSIRRKDFFLLFGVSFIGFVNSILYLYGLKLTTASNAGVVASTIPLFILIISFISKTERPTFFIVLGIGVGFIGTLTLNWGHGEFSAHAGDWIVLSACAFIAMFTVFSKKVVTLYSSMVSAGWIFSLSFVYQLPLFLLRLPGQSWTTLPAATWINFWISIIGPMFIANALYFHAVKAVGPSRVGVYTYLIPFFTLFFAYVLRGETITLQQITGLVVIITGIVITKKKMYRKQVAK